MNLITKLSISLNVIGLSFFLYSNQKNDIFPDALIETEDSVIIKKINGGEITYNFENGLLERLSIVTNGSDVQEINFYKSGFMKSFSNSRQLGFSNGIMMYDFESVTLNEKRKIQSVNLSDSTNQLLWIARDDEGNIYDLMSNEMLVFDPMKHDKIKIIPSEQDR